LTRLGDLITTILGLNEFISSINIAFFLWVMLEVILLSLLCVAKNDMTFKITIELVTEHSWILISCDFKIHIILLGDTWVTSRITYSILYASELINKSTMVDIDV